MLCSFRMLNCGGKINYAPVKPRLSKYWVFTLNNYSDSELVNLNTIHGHEDVSYIVFGKEVGESGTPHLQGYVEFSRRLRLNQVKDLLGSRIFAEKRRGTGGEASSYCKKDGNFQEFGTMNVGQGARMDLAWYYSFIN